MMFERTRFTGTLSGHGSSHPVIFTAEIDQEGVLAVKLVPIPYSESVLHLLHEPEPTELLDQITLKGVSENGTQFHSDSFSILHFSHGHIEGQELDIQGDCALADITRVATKPVERSSKVWLMRKFSSLHRVMHETPTGMVIIGGADISAESQEPRGFVHLKHPSGLADDIWWEESERFLIHLARVLSFGCGSYFQPVVERRFHGAEERLRVVRRGRAARPQLAPFSFDGLAAILALACDTYVGKAETVLAIDPAIRWLTMPAPTWESQLVNAMTAIENLLDHMTETGPRLIQPEKTFKRTIRPVRELLSANGAPSAMIEKLPELNRRTFRDQLEASLAAWRVVTDDFPEGWLPALINTRNAIIHTGVLPKTVDVTGGIPGHVIWAREIAARLILHILGFEGGYRSWLHRDRPLHFPSCRPMAGIATT